MKLQFKLVGLPGQLLSDFILKAEKPGLASPVIEMPLQKELPALDVFLKAILRACMRIDPLEKRIAGLMTCDSPGFFWVKTKHQTNIDKPGICFCFTNKRIQNLKNPGNWWMAVPNLCGVFPAWWRLRNLSINED